ncbi:MAG: hypothetical protein K2M93_01500 [Muribaculaceae bacterium]|nr:hypothetical protein [Muribaculaceae bacterium]
MKRILTVISAVMLLGIFAMTGGAKSAASRAEVPDEVRTDTTAADSIQLILALPDSVATDSVAPLVASPRTPRKINPVDSDDDKPREVLHYYDKHGNPLPEPVRFLAVLDTVTKPKSKPLYPLYNGWTLGVNFADAILWATGQRHAGFDIWADVSLFNWLFPVVEAGVGFADYSPENANFTYRTSPSFYTKIGFNYNFMYKSDPAYHVFAGFRAGFSHFRYDVDNVTISNDYWQETQHFNMRGLSATAFYGEVLAGLKVKITGRFSLGWTARWHFKFKVSSSGGSSPWYIPGYGANSPFGFSLSAMWRFGQDKIEQTESK